MAQLTPSDTSKWPIHHSAVYLSAFHGISPVPITQTKENEDEKFPQELITITPSPGAISSNLNVDNWILVCGSARCDISLFLFSVVLLWLGIDFSVFWMLWPQWIMDSSGLGLKIKVFIWSIHSKRNLHNWSQIHRDIAKKLLSSSWLFRISNAVASIPHIFSRMRAQNKGIYMMYP